MSDLNVGSIPVSAGDIMNVLFQNRFIAGTTLVVSTTTGIVLGMTLMDKINNLVERCFKNSENVRSSILYKATLVSAGFIPLIGMHLAATKFLPIPFSNRTSAIIALSMLATFALIGLSLYSYGKTLKPIAREDFPND